VGAELFIAPKRFEDLRTRYGNYSRSHFNCPGKAWGRVRDIEMATCEDVNVVA